MTTLVNVLTVDPTNQSRLLDLLRDNIDTVIRTLDGWIATNLIASADGTRVVIHSQWRNAAAVEGLTAMLVYDRKVSLDIPAYFVTLEFEGDRVARIRDFLFARYAMESLEPRALDQ